VSVGPSRGWDVVDALTFRLSAVRRKRKPAPGYVKADNVRTFVQSSTVPSLHSTKPAGITALDLCVGKDLALTGGADKTVQVFDLSSEKTLKTLKGHTKVVNHVEFVGGETSMLISSSADKTVKVWQATSGEENDWALGHNYTGHKGEIAGFAVHPSRKFFAIGSADSTWSLRDLETTETIKTYQPISSFEGSFGYSSFGMHPDGVLFCGGTQDGKLRIWDARDDKSLAASLDGLDGNPVTTLSFSENGYYLAAGSKTHANVDIFDLRKLNLQASIAYGTSDVSRINEVRFDPSAQFLSVAGTELKLYANKTWEEVVVFDDNAAELTAARWGRLGEKVVLAGMDRTLRVLSAPA
jgi:pre-mRNA-processing factor 19